MSVLFGADQQVARWVADELGYTGFAGNFMAAFASIKDGQLLGGTVFHNYYPDEGVIEMTSASVHSGWLSRRMILAIFTYVFDVLRCQLVVMRVGEDNKRMIKIATGFGFKGYLIDRLRGKNKAEWVFTYTDDQWALSRYRRVKEVCHR